jgi:hypothetical protein
MQIWKVQMPDGALLAPDRADWAGMIGDDEFAAAARLRRYIEGRKRLRSG